MRTAFDDSAAIHHQNYIRRKRLFPELPDQFVVIGVGANPIPDDGIAVTDTNSAIIQPNSHRINWTGRMNGIEA